MRAQNLLHVALSLPLFFVGCSDTSPTEDQNNSGGATEPLGSNLPPETPGSGGTQPQVGGSGSHSGGAPAGTGGAQSGGAGNIDTGTGGNSAGGQNNLGGENSEGGTSSGGSGGAPSADAWSDCPTFADYKPQNAWNREIQVTQGARYCAHDSNEYELKTKLANKAILRFPAGTYKLPADLMSQAVVLPACVLKAGASKATRVAVKLSDDNAPASGTYQVVGLEHGLDGGYHPNLFGHAQTYVTLQTGDQRHLFDSCDYSELATEEKRVAFEGGSLTFDVRWVSGSVGYGAGVLLRARGTYKGQAIDQQDFFKLGVIGLRHFYVGSAVVFDAPIDSVCALEFTSINYDAPDRAVAWNCDYSKSTNVPLR